MVGTPLDDGAIEAAIDLIDDAIEPDSDLHGTGDYRRRVCGVLIARAVRDAKFEARA